VYSHSYDTVSLEINQLSKDNKARSLFKLRSLVLFIAVSNVLFHFVLWNLGFWHPFAFLSLLSFLFVLPGLKYEYDRDYSRRKKRFVKRNIRTYFPSLHYKLEPFIPEESFLSSWLYNDPAFHTVGSDLLSDSIISILNINVSSPQSKTTEETMVFKGILARVKHGGSFSTHTIIKPSFAIENEDLSPVFQKLSQRYIPDDIQKIQVGDKNFDQQFEVYCNNQKDINKMIPDSYAQLILSIKEEIDELIKEEKTIGKNTLFSRFTVLKNTPLEVYIANEYTYIGIRDARLFQFSGDEDWDDTYKKSIKMINVLCKMRAYYQA